MVQHCSLESTIPPLFSPWLPLNGPFSIGNELLACMLLSLMPLPRYSHTHTSVFYDILPPCLLRKKMFEEPCGTQMGEAYYYTAKSGVGEIKNLQLKLLSLGVADSHRGTVLLGANHTVCIDHIFHDQSGVECGQILLVCVHHVLHSSLLHILWDDGGCAHPKPSSCSNCRLRILLRL